MNNNKRYCCKNITQKKDNTECNTDMIENSPPCSNICHANEMNCMCGFDTDVDSTFPANPMLAQSYVPVQKMNKVFTPEVGLRMGTIFPELVSPYYPGQSIQTNEFIKATNSIGEGCNR